MDKLDDLLTYTKAGLVFVMEIPRLVLGCTGIWVADRVKDTVNSLIVGQDSEK